MPTMLSSCRNSSGFLGVDCGAMAHARGPEREQEQQQEWIERSATAATSATTVTTIAAIVTGWRGNRGRRGWRRGGRWQRHHAGVTVDHRVDLVETALGEGCDRRVDRRRHDVLAERRGGTLPRAIVRGAEHMPDLVRDDERIQRGAAVSHGETGGITLAAERRVIADACGVAVELATGDQMREAGGGKRRSPSSQLSQLIDQRARIGGRGQLRARFTADIHRYDLQFDSQLRAEDPVHVIDASKNRLAGLRFAFVAR